MGHSPSTTHLTGTCVSYHPFPIRKVAATTPLIGEYFRSVSSFGGSTLGTGGQRAEAIKSPFRPPSRRLKASICAVMCSLGLHSGDRVFFGPQGSACPCYRI